MKYAKGETRGKDRGGIGRRHAETTGPVSSTIKGRLLDIIIWDMCGYVIELMGDLDHEVYVCCIRVQCSGNVWGCNGRNSERSLMLVHRREETKKLRCRCGTCHGLENGTCGAVFIFLMCDFLDDTNHKHVDAIEKENTSGL